MVRVSTISEAMLHPDESWLCVTCSGTGFLKLFRHAARWQMLMRTWSGYRNSWDVTPTTQRSLPCFGLGASAILPRPHQIRISGCQKSPRPSPSKDFHFGTSNYSGLFLNPSVLFLKHYPGLIRKDPLNQSTFWATWRNLKFFQVRAT